MFSCPDRELRDDQDGKTSYGRDVAEDLQRRKEDFVMMRAFAHAGIRHFPGLPNDGRGFSSAFSVIPNEQMSDREAEKGSGPSEEEANHGKNSGSSKPQEVLEGEGEKTPKEDMAGPSTEGEKSQGSTQEASPIEEFYQMLVKIANPKVRTL